MIDATKWHRSFHETNFSNHSSRINNLAALFKLHSSFLLLLSCSSPHSFAHSADCDALSERRGKRFLHRPYAPFYPNSFPSSGRMNGTSGLRLWEIGLPPSIPVSHFIPLENKKLWPQFPKEGTAKTRGLVLRFLKKRRGRNTKQTKWEMCVCVCVFPHVSPESVLLQDEVLQLVCRA